MKVSSVRTIARGEVNYHALSARRRSPQRNMIWVPSEFGDVLLHPLHDFFLVAESVVGRDVFPIGKKPVRTDTIIEADNHDIVAAGLYEPRGIDVGVGVEVEPASLDV